MEGGYDSAGRHQRADVQHIPTHPGLRKAERYRPAKPEHAEAYAALRALGEPLSSTRAALALGWTVQRAQRWLDLFRRKGVLELTRNGYVWRTEAA
jgi:hypothetical protein